MASMQPRRLTFACELDPARLTALFADPAVVADLQALGAHVALMLADLGDERAAVVRQLNSADIPVVAVPLVPAAEGYYFTADNAQRAAARYDEWTAWTARHGLVWEGVGLDIEPEARFYQQIMDNPWALPALLLPRLRDRERPRRARAAYGALVARIRAAGYRVENYQFPLIADERWARSTLLQRLMGLVDVRTDREVWMLYTSVLPGIGPGLLWSYGPQAQAIGVGSTGGGPDIPGHPEVPALGGVGARPAPGPALQRRPADPQPGRVRAPGLPGAAALLRLAAGGDATADGVARGGPARRVARAAVDERPPLERAWSRGRRRSARVGPAITCPKCAPRIWPRRSSPASSAPPFLRSLGGTTWTDAMRRRTPVALVIRNVEGTLRARPEPR